MIFEPETEFLSQHLDSCLVKQNIDAKSYAQRISLAHEFAIKRDYDSALVEYTRASQSLRTRIPRRPTLLKRNRSRAKGRAE